tara:strand:+ start:1236 stop:2168 length:933 start_codon:yes stop_codon:yes gene_type:complete
MKIAVEKLAHTYDSDRLVIADFNFSLQEGEIVALLGRNGAGKSTLVNCLSGSLAYTSGRIAINNEAISGLKVPRKYLSIAEQEIGLYPSISTRQNLEFFVNMFGDSPKLRSRKKHIVDFFKIENLLDLRTEQLSVGQRRLVHCCIAFLHERPFYVLDEPTAGLDIDSRERLLHFTKEIADEGKGVLYCTHYLEEVDYLNPTLLLLHQGRILANEPLQSLKAKHPEEGFDVCFRDHESLNHLPLEILDNYSTHGNCLSIQGSNSTLNLARILSLASEKDMRVEQVKTRNSGVDSLFRKLTGEGFQTEQRTE